ncbi:MAG TPA: hypothetical protein VFG30_29575 [Polyangiales bacterium]|nr:hypothetical protein [Polyangiales bacterium]
MACVCAILFFPYAGGIAGASSLRQEDRPGDVEVRALRHIDLPYAFIGHNLGAVVAFELTRPPRRVGHSGPGALL